LHVKHLHSDSDSDVKFTAIVPAAYLGEAKMCLRLSWRGRM